MTRQMVDAILSMQEYNRFTKGIFGWVGFNTKWLEFENVERARGETKWNFWKLFLYSLDGITAFSTVPLMLASVVGVLFAACFYYDYFYHCEKADFRGSGFRLAFSGLHYSDDKRRAVFLHGDSGTVSCENLYGGKAPSYLSC